MSDVLEAEAEVSAFCAEFAGAAGGAADIAESAGFAFFDVEAPQPIGARVETHSRAEALVGGH